MIKNFFLQLNARWRFLFLILSGMALGLFGFVFWISNAPSYLSDAPETCINCHVMMPQYSTYQHSSHREHATCNDCHVPQDHWYRKYYFKAMDGLRHATIFTLRMEPQVIFIKEEGQKVVHENCVRCHSNLLADSKLMSQTAQQAHNKTDKLCWDCHREVPHGRVNGLSSTPQIKTLDQAERYPEWLKKSVINKKE